MRTKPDNPHDGLGVYKTLNDVPKRYRLDNHEGIYINRNPWEEFVDDKGINELCDDRENKYWRGYERWLKIIDGTGRHYALAHPEDAETFAESLVRRFRLRTAYQQWSTIERFYRWMAWRTDHPHHYNPFWMAASQYPHSEEIWEYEMTERRK